MKLLGLRVDFELSGRHGELIWRLDRAKAYRLGVGPVVTRAKRHSRAAILGVVRALALVVIRWHDHVEHGGAALTRCECVHVTLAWRERRRARRAQPSAAAAAAARARRRGPAAREAHARAAGRVGPAAASAPEARPHPPARGRAARRGARVVDPIVRDDVELRAPAATH